MKNHLCSRLAFAAAACALGCAAPSPYRDPASVRGSLESAFLQWRGAMLMLTPGEFAGRAGIVKNPALVALDDASVSAAIEQLARAHADLKLVNPADLAFEDRIDHELLSRRVSADILTMSKVAPFDRDPLWAVENVTKTLAAASSEPEGGAAFIVALAQIPPYLIAARARSQAPSQLHTDLAVEIAEAFLEHLSSEEVRKLGAGQPDGASAIGAARAAVVEHRDWLYRTALVASGHHSVGREVLDELLRLEVAENINVSTLVEIAGAELEGARKRLLAAAAERFPESRDEAELLERAVAVVTDGAPLDQAQLAKCAADAAASARLHAAPAGYALGPNADAAVHVGKGARLDRALASGSVAETSSDHQVSVIFHIASPLDRFGLATRLSWLRQSAPQRLRQAFLARIFPGEILAECIQASGKSPIRMLVHNRGWLAGWGDRARREVVASASAGDPSLALAGAFEDVLVAARALAAARIHSGAASVAEAVELFRRRCGLETEWARREAQACAADPGVALVLAGRVELDRIAADLAQRKGLSNHTISQLILQKGALPLPTLRSILIGE